MVARKRLQNRKQHTGASGWLLVGRSYLVPETLEILLSAQVPEVDPDAGHVHLSDVQSHRGGDLGGVQALVVLLELGLGCLQVGLTGEKEPVNRCKTAVPQTLGLRGAPTSKVILRTTNVTSQSRQTKNKVSRNNGKSN